MSDGPSPASSGTAATDSQAATLLAAIDALAGQEPSDLAPAVALERTRLMMVQCERLKALALRALADVDSRQLHLIDEQPTTTAWVQAQHVPGMGKQEVALARRLRKVPTVAEQLQAGLISAPDAAKVTTTVAKARPFLDQADGRIDGQPAEETLYGVLVDGICSLLAEQTGGTLDDDPQQHKLRAELEQLNDRSLPQRQRVEACLVAFALRCQPGLLASGLELLLDALLPAQHEKRAREAADRRGLTLTHHGDGSGWTLRGALDDLTGEMLHTVVTAQTAVDPENPLDTNAWRAANDNPHLEGLNPQDWPIGQPRPRTKAEQRHDALRDALRRILDNAGLDHRDKASPHILVTVDLDYMHALPGALPARTLSGLRLARHQLRDLLCRSRLTRMVLDARHRVIETSHGQRTLTHAERQILYLQWGHRCSRAGCIRGPATGDKLIPHHPELFSNTGITSLEDSAPLCEQDHHYLHDEHRPITLKDGRVLGPHGWITAAA